MSNTNQVPGAVLKTSVIIPSTVHTKVFAASTAETFTVPTDINFVIMSGSVPFYVRTTGTAEIPADDISDGIGSFYIPSSAEWEVDDGSDISIIPTGAGIVTIGCWSR